MQQNLEYKLPHPFWGSPRAIPATSQQTHLKAYLELMQGWNCFCFSVFHRSISDKEIVIKSGFLEILKNKVTVGEILAADTVMADKGFDIGDDLKNVNLRIKLHIPPFLTN